MNSISYATAAALVAVALVLHFAAGIDWPWAIVAGAAVSLLVRLLVQHRRPAARL